MTNLLITSSNIIRMGMSVRFPFSLKNESNEKESDFRDFTAYNYNKYNAPNIVFDEKTKKDIEQSFGKIQERYEKNPQRFQPDYSKKNEDVNSGNAENHILKPVYKYSSFDYIPRVYYECDSNQDDDNKHKGNDD